MRRPAQFVLMVFAACLCIATGYAQIRAPEEVDFNYPPAPVEGKADTFVIVKEGEARACLIIPEKAALDEVRAARNMRFYIEKATGAALPLLKDGEALPEGLGRIYIGETSAGKATPLDLPPVRYGNVEMPNINAYLIKTVDPQTLVIRGATAKATLLGAVGLLRRYVGVRRYWPGEPGGIGDLVPKRSSLSLPEVEWRDWPYFVSRIMSGLDNRGPKNTAEQFLTFSDFWRMNYALPSNESYYRLMSAKDHLDEPELFPLINGKRFIPRVDERGRVTHGWQPCVSNPRVAELMIEYLLEKFRSEPERIGMNLAVNDGYGDCTCEACRAMDAPGADALNRIGLCDRYVKFDNIVAEAVGEEYPDRMLAFIAYGSMREPPTTVKLHPMLVPVLCVGGNAFEMWDKWQATGPKHMGIYLYHDDIRSLMPKLDIHQSAKRLRYIVGTNLARHFYQEFYGIYPLNGMVGYVENELIWDPRLNEDDVLDEFYEGFFGPAAGAMKAFYDELEVGYEEWLAEYGLPHPYGKDMSSIVDTKTIEQFNVLPVARAEKASGHIAEALAAAKDDELVTERIKLVKMLYDFAVPGAKAYWAMDRLRTGEFASMAAAEQAVSDAREAVDNVLALAEYKFAVMEKPPATEYAAHTVSAQFYNDLEQAVVHPRILSTTASAFRNVSAYLLEALGKEKAVAWWTAQEKEETRPALQELMAVARFHASGKELENMIADPSFEERGVKGFTGAGDDLPPGHELRDGVNVWCGAGSPMSCSLTDEDAHTGKYAFAFWKTQHAGVSEGISVKGGEKLLMSVWVKHNDGDGVYKVDALPRGDAMLARYTVAVPDKPGEWQKVEIPFNVPPGARTIRIYVFVDRQAPDARILVDDFFIGKYPD